MEKAGTLMIDCEKFGLAVWQEKGCLFTQREYNVWLKGAADNLSDICDILEDNDEISPGRLELLQSLSSLLYNIEIKIQQ